MSVVYKRIEGKKYLTIILYYASLYTEILTVLAGAL
jgi:hypothetical protein